MGLPGDFSPTSRFVRMAFSKTHLQLSSHLNEALFDCFNLMKVVSIPKGVVVTEDGKPVYTQYTSFMNLNTGDYYFNTYSNPNIRRANLHNICSSKIVSLGKFDCCAQIPHI